MSRKILSALLAIVLTVATLSSCETPTDKDDKDDSSKTPSENDSYYDYDLSEYITLAELDTDIPRSKLDEEARTEYKSIAPKNAIIYGGSAEGALPADGITVQEGDTVNIDYCGKKDGIAFEGGTAEKQDLEIGSNSFIEGFEAGLIGIEIGDTVDLNLKFPDPYHSKELAGQSVVFTVTIHYLSRPTTPEYNEENVKKYTGFTIAEFEKQMAGIIIFDRLYNQTNVTKYPEKELNAVRAKYMKNYEEAAATYGLSIESYLSYMGVSLDEFNEYVDSTAKQYVKRDMIAYSIVAANPSLKLTEEEYEKEFKSYWEDSVANGFKGTLEEFREEVDRIDVEANIYVQKVITHLGNQVQIIQ